VERVKADLNSSRNQVRNARQYLNFLVNRDLDHEVNTTSSLENIPLVMDSAGLVTNREEIQMLRVQQSTTIVAS
jgi:hypothetical protein